MAKKGKNFLNKVKSRFSGLRSKYFSNKKQTSGPKLKEHPISKTNKLNKNSFEKKESKRPTLKSCGIKRSKRTDSRCGSPVTGEKIPDQNKRIRTEDEAGTSGHQNKIINIDNSNDFPIAFEQIEARKGEPYSIISKYIKTAVKKHLLISFYLIN